MEGVREKRASTGIELLSASRCRVRRHSLPPSLVLSVSQVVDLSFNALAMNSLSLNYIVADLASGFFRAIFNGESHCCECRTNEEN